MKARECQIAPPLTDKNHSMVGRGLKFDFWADNNAALCTWRVDTPPMGRDATDHTHTSHGRLHLQVERSVKVARSSLGGG